MSNTFKTIVAAALAAAGNGPVTPASTPWPARSDPVAVYALVDRVDLQPSAERAERIRIDGAFALFGGRHGDYYQAPRWGSLYFELVAEKTARCREQWTDLAAVAGTGEVVGIGSRWECATGVALQAADAAQPTWAAYPTGIGVRKVRNADYGPVAALRTLPRPIGPVGRIEFQIDYRKLPFREATLEIANCRGAREGDAYVFEVERPNGECYGSPLIPAGERRTTWRTLIVAHAGERVRWRVRLIRDGLRRAPIATASFVVRVAPRKARRR